MNSHLASKMPRFYVAYMDVGEGREQGSGSFANLRNSQLLRAIHALNLNILNHNLLRSELIRGSLDERTTNET